MGVPLVRRGLGEASGRRVEGRLRLSRERGLRAVEVTPTARQRSCMKRMIKANDKERKRDSVVPAVTTLVNYKGWRCRDAKTEREKERWKITQEQWTSSTALARRISTRGSFAGSERTHSRIRLWRDGPHARAGMCMGAVPTSGIRHR
jgi:hypothetical protein